MFGLFLRSPHFRATSSGSTSLNSPLAPSQAMQVEFLGSDKSSRRNCHNWICPLPVLAGSGRFATLPLEKELGSDWDSGTDIGLDGTTLSFMCDSLAVEDGVDQDAGLLSRESKKKREPLRKTQQEPNKSGSTAKKKSLL